MLTKREKQADRERYVLYQLSYLGLSPTLKTRPQPAASPQWALPAESEFQNMSDNYASCDGCNCDK